MTVNGIACDPSNCLVIMPGQYTFSGSSLVDGQIVDIQYGVQSILPSGVGGTVVSRVVVDGVAASVSSVQNGVDLGGTTACTAEITATQIIDTCTSVIGASSHTGGDFQATWVQVVGPPQPPTCTPPLIGVPPDCHPVIPPPPLTCVPPLVGTPPDCQPVVPPVVPPVIPPVTPPTCADYGEVGDYPQCHTVPPIAPPCVATNSCGSVVPPTINLAQIPTLSEWGVLALLAVVLAVGIYHLYKAQYSGEEDD